MAKIYAGIGSRETPLEILEVMTSLATILAGAGWTLRSGGAPGADTAFEKGAAHVSGPTEIFLPWSGFENHTSLYSSPTPAALDLAKKHHPAWDKLSGPAKKLMGRNSHQVMGADLQTPVDVVICWTPGGGMSGGTSQALRIALDHGIPIINLANCVPSPTAAQEIAASIPAVLRMIYALVHPHEVTPESVGHEQQALFSEELSVETPVAEPTENENRLTVVTGDIWDAHKDSWVCITTNGMLKQDGTAVMGAGIAKEAADRFPDLPRRLGENISKYGNRLFIYRDIRIITFPTKHDWKDKSDLELIRKSCRELMEVAHKFGIERISLPKPGCSNGGLSWDDVRPAIEPILDASIVFIVDKK